MHVGPPAANIPAIVPFTAFWMSASGKTMLGDLPPSSSSVGVRFSAACSDILRAVSMPPVNDSLPMPGWLAMAAPVTPPYPVTTLKMPGGKPSLLNELGKLQRGG